VPQYNWIGPGPGGFIDASVWQNIPTGWYYITVEDNVCSVSDSVFVDVLDPPVAEFSASVTAGCAPLNVSFTNTSQNANTFSWNFGDGQSASSNDLSAQNHVFDVPFGTYIVTLTANQGPQCSDVTTIAIQVDVCGCTDPQATNYNANANVNDGSCVYPTGCTDSLALNFDATAQIDDGSCQYEQPFGPNVISPNNDGDNDVFFIRNTESLTSLELIILNRWGNVVYQELSTNVQLKNPQWDGKIDGQTAEEGIYFYKFVGYLGVNLQETTGHGFLHLVDKQ
jgi:gliding motility-associated-like protein